MTNCYCLHENQTVTIVEAGSLAKTVALWQSVFLSWSDHSFTWKKKLPALLLCRLKEPEKEHLQGAQFTWVSSSCSIEIKQLDLRFIPTSVTHGKIISPTIHQFCIFMKWIWCIITRMTSVILSYRPSWTSVKSSWVRSRTPIKMSYHEATTSNSIT